ncbi:hypothetical protein [Sphaerisporangium corydalis]|uniref:YtxH domain-containing protein n=1 Tax=Sphaerisporangium corydalis TaxID=1441875 RepID=A0ABV9E5W1_9ACTN|nr:hypothetical protein [Sphaerisporangium corydalis]
MRWWKILGLAGFAGVAATGVVIARAERRRRAYTPEEIRSRLRDRLAEASAAGPPPVTTTPAAGTGLAARARRVRSLARDRLGQVKGRFHRKDVLLRRR